LNSAEKNIFFLGKGGTGKTTISALTAVHLSSLGRQVALISLDPAHNVFDVFNVSGSANVVEINSNLVLEEVDIQNWIDRYLSGIEKKITQSYTYLTSLNLEKQLSIIQYSPGVQEYALIYAYQSMLKKYKHKTHRIFDMPPTALSVRFMNLPGLSRIWLEKLIELRIKILKNKNIIYTVKNAKKTEIKDRVLSDLKQMEAEYQQLYENFSSRENSVVNLVLNEDDLSVNESLDILKQLQQIGIHVHHFIINKYQQKISPEELANKLNRADLSYIPHADHSLAGSENLEYFIRSGEICAELEKNF
jgi:arsenite-transporting ATPase